MCTWLSSPCRGASPAGWQFLQRGDSKTVQARRKDDCDAAAFEESSDPKSGVTSLIPVRAFAAARDGTARAAATGPISACCDHANEPAPSAATTKPAVRRAERFRVLFSLIFDP